MAKYIDNRFYSLEIGTHSLKLLAADYNDDGTFDILEYAEAPTGNKVEKGQIIDVETIHEPFNKASLKLENSLNEVMTKLIVSVSGPHIATKNITGSVGVESEDRVISDVDIVAVAKHARSYRLPEGKAAINVIGRYYTIDDNNVVSNPENMIGQNLSQEMQVVYGDSNILETLQNIFYSQYGEDFSLELSFAGISSFLGVTEKYEQEEGALCIDIGYGTTDYAIYKDETCQHTGTFSIGCKHLVNDLHVGLDLPFVVCKRLFEQCGSARSQGDGRSRMVKVPLPGGKEREIPHSSIEQIIELRLREIFNLIKRDLVENEVENTFSSGVILCGGGAKIKEIEGLAKEEFKAPVRIGHAMGFSGDTEIVSNPAFANCCGALRVAHLMESIEEAKARPSLIADFKASLVKTFKDFLNALNW